MRVLFPTDGSEQTEGSFKNLIRLLADKPGLEVTVLVVQHTGMEAADPELVNEFDEDERDEIFPTKESGQRAIESLRQIARPYGIEVRGSVKPGNFQKVILQEAAKFDVLVMHEISKSNLKDFFSGSKIERLLRGAESPAVLLVRSDVELPEPALRGTQAEKA